MPSVKPSTFEMYGMDWDAGTDPLSIEFWMIRQGEKWLREQGRSLLEHYQALQTLIWPEKVWHKWNTLELKCYLENRIIGEMGPASSGKSFSAATNVLVDYYCFPDCTTVLFSSTEREMLEMRVWGEVKKLHRIAKERYPELPGNLIESRQRIVTDSIGLTSEGRDFRNGCCFPSETMVETPCGEKRIDSIQVGDLVVNATGFGIVSKVHRNISPSLIRVSLADGRKIDCTSEHPFFTRRGWIKAVELNTSDMVLSAHDAMQIMRQRNAFRLSESKVLQCGMPGSSSEKEMRAMRCGISTVEPKTGVERTDRGEILQSWMRRKMGRRPQVGKARNEAMHSLREENVIGSFQQEVLLPEMQATLRDFSMPSMRKSVHFDCGFSEQAEDSFLQQILQAESDWPSELQETSKTNRRGTSGVEIISRINFSLPFEHGTDDKAQSQTLVSIGHRFPEFEVGSRDQRRDSQNSIEGEEANSENQNIKGVRVDRVEFLEPRGDKRFDESEGGYRVHNLEVEGHPSYSVNGVLVHNCGVPCKKGDSYVGMGSFAGIKNKRVRLVADECSLMPQIYVEAISNLNKNPDFKCLALGNPKSTTDALGRICEPADKLGGWDGGIDQTGSTKTWETRFDKGVCVQLVGSDSPNLDGELGIDLITQNQIDADIKFYGKDSLQFTMMNEGRMPRGEGSRRVITRAMCIKFHAMDQPVWGVGEITSVGFLDAAYGSVGGDRCIFGELRFGNDVNGKQTIGLVETVLVPVNARRTDELPEDQIAHFVHSECTRRSIPPEQFFYDSGMRTALVMALSRIWSPQVQSIDFGGPATDRPVDTGLFVTENGRKRLKTCREHYFNFCSELWFSVQYAIEANQFRGMTEDVMFEGCNREWGKAGNNKIQVEPKEKMKARFGRSPDLFDALVTGVEGARRLGFIIARLQSTEDFDDDQTWKHDLALKARAIRQSYALIRS